MLNKLMIYRYLLLVGLLFGGMSVVAAQDAAEEGGEAAAESSGAADAAAGETIFLNNCAQCHARDMRTALTGPALGEVESRWDSQEDLYAWIRNSQALIADGHPRATELWNEWKPTVMPAYPNLTDQDMVNILAYINQQYVASGQTEVAGEDGVTVATEKEDNTLLFVILLVILSVLAVVLARIISNLNYMSQVREGMAPAKRKTLVDILTSRGVIGFVIFALVVLGGYTTVNNAIELGRQQGYQPEQPIKFSHAVHAGQYEIDCQYCHDGARRSKHSVIPATNTCMNCHTAIKVGSQYGTAELTKIYASIGYDPSTDTYFSADSVSTEQMEEIYKKWIADNYVKETGGMDDEGERVINEQWNEIVASLTNTESDDQIQGPIEWVRIHNLPDHVYFNHAQHVTVGEVECQTCHGQIQEMEVVAQHSPLSMGWCINCHRQTEVAQFEDNDYYKAYQDYHKELSEGERDNVTVEDIGGLGCQKCHY